MRDIAAPASGNSRYDRNANTVPGMRSDRIHSYDVNVIQLEEQVKRLYIKIILSNEKA